LLSALLTIDPDGRPDASGIKAHAFFGWSEAEWEKGLLKQWTPPMKPRGELKNINPSFLSVPVDEELHESPPQNGLYDFNNFTYNGDTVIDRGRASDHGGGDPYM
jgi:hypothetical protein